MNKFDKVLALHCHTTGLNYGGDITDGHQVLTVALAVLDLDRVNIIDSLELQVQYDESKIIWNSKLESIHGLSKQDALNGGMEVQEATTKIALFLAKHFDISKSIATFGYNINSFHLPFLVKLLNEEELYFKFDTRPIDLYPITSLIGKFSVYDSIEYLIQKIDGPISSMDFIRYYIKIYKLMKILISNSLEN